MRNTGLDWCIAIPPAAAFWRNTSLGILLLIAAALPAAAARAPQTSQRAMQIQEPLPPRTARDVLVDAGQLEEEVDQLLEGLSAVRALTETKSTPDGRRALQRELESLRTRLLALRDLVREAPAGIPAPSDVVVVTPPQEETPSVDPAQPPMARDDFEAALASVESHGFAGERLDVVAELAQRNWFVVEQARRVIESFSFGKDRLQALELLAPRIVDPQNNFRLYEAFTFESDKTQARRILSAQQP